jgi:hypothetical protein
VFWLYDLSTKQKQENDHADDVSRQWHPHNAVEYFPCDTDGKNDGKLERYSHGRLLV